MHPTAGVVADELLRGQVEASMTPVVDARIPPASGPDATATDVVNGDPSGTPPATVLVADAFDCGRVEVVPLPISPTLVPLLQPSEAPPAAVVVDDESARSQVEDVPMPFVQARISLGSTSASVSAATTPITANADVVVLGEAPPAIANGDGESACSMVGDVPMSPVDARLPPTFTLTAPTATSANTVDVKPGEGPVIFQELARTQVEDVPLPRIDTSGSFHFCPSSSSHIHGHYYWCG